jgi:protoporphyrinogen oxidase
LYKFFFKSFTRRYWGIHPRGLSVTFIKTKMPRLSAVAVLKKAFGKVGACGKGVDAVASALSEETLHYSHTGAEAMPRGIARAIDEAGGRVILNAEISKIDVHDHRVTRIGYLQDGVEKHLDCDECISTIPLPVLARKTEPPPPDDVFDAAGHLHFKPIAVYGLLVKKEQCIDALYIYYRDRSFHRVGEPKNAGLIVKPEGHTILIIETTCEIGDHRWEGHEKARNIIYKDLEREGLCTRNEIVETHILRSETGYPIFTLGFEPYRDAVMNWVDSIENLQSDGRQGGFKYPNMHSAMRMGADAADVVLKRIGVSTAAADTN